MLNRDFAQCQCRDHEPTTLDRPALFIPIIAVMFASCTFLFTLADVSYGIPLATLIPYTALVILTTFSAQRGQQPYFFGCSIVRRNLPRLARRHGVFFAAIVVIETVALHLRPYLPVWWLTSRGKDASPFAITLFIFCPCLAFAQILSNRSLLERVHLESNRHV
jgi:hypothetical protein